MVPASVRQKENIALFRVQHLPVYLKRAAPLNDIFERHKIAAFSFYIKFIIANRFTHEIDGKRPLFLVLLTRNGDLF